jgi:aspartyl aminopeptidase
MFDQFSEFVDACPTPFHFAAHVRTLLTARGFTEVHESLPPPSPYPANGFVIRHERSLFAWRDNGHAASVLTSAHCDSPCFILKRIPECPGSGYPRLRCSTYGGGLWYSWVDRPLRLAGQVIVERDGTGAITLFDSRKPIGVFPSTAVHFAAKSAYQPTLDLEDGFVACYGTGTPPGLFEYVAQELGVAPDKILGSDLRFVSADRPALHPGGLLAGPRLDNLIGAFVNLNAFLAAAPADGCLNGVVVFDTEEIGSLTKNGALSPWINEILGRIVSGDALRVMKANSLCINVDVVHAAHPNWPETNDPDHQPVLGGGATIERDPQASLGHAGYIALRDAAARIGRPFQIAAERSVVASSGDDGPYIETNTGISVSEIGAPLLAMHAVRELAAIGDVEHLIAILTDVYEHRPLADVPWE